MALSDQPHLHVRLSPEEADQLRQLTECEDRTASAVVRRLIRAAYEKLARARAVRGAR